ncbi:MAG: copper-binding protein [Polaromonas sp.]|nr:copper-binding protein [Polaromonas sp.]
MKRLSAPRTALLATLAFSAFSVFAQATLPQTEGEVRKVDKDTGKITLKHGEIKNLDMPPMTMVFKAKDPALLDKVKAGDKVRFTADQVGGTLRLVSIEPGK